MTTPYERTVASLSRRRFLDAASKLGAAGALSCVPVSRALAQPLFRAYPFSLGVASGDPLPGGVVLWTRLAPEPLAGGGMPMAAVEVNWEVAADEAMRRTVRRGTELARPELGHAVHAEVDGLEPGREYWYRFAVGGERSQVGRTRTAPAPGAAVERLRFGTCGCSNYESGHFTAYRHLAAERFDFVFHSGDYLYEGRADGGRRGKVRQHLGDELYTLEHYRNRYAQYKSDPDLMAAHASAPFVATWDDHEVRDNWAADSDNRDTPPALFLLRRAAAFQAYYEAMPLRRASVPGAAGLRLHRDLAFGDLVAFNALDTRQYRSRQACGRGSAARCEAEFADRTRTMLGAEQERWLDARLGASRARWNVVAQQVPIFGVGASGRASRNPHLMDQWPGYPGARQRLLDSIVDRGLRNVVFLSGDVHLHWGANVPRRLEEPGAEPVAVEFTNTSISSGGDGRGVVPWWEHARADNPQVAFHADRRGYVACEVTPDAWRTDFMTVDTVEREHGTLSRGGTVVVERGSPVGHAS